MRINDIEEKLIKMHLIKNAVFSVDKKTVVSVKRITTITDIYASVAAG